MPLPLVRPRGGEVGDVLPQHASQVRLAQDEDVVEAPAPHAPEEALAGGVRPRCPDRGAHDRDPTAGRDAGERRPVLGVIVAGEVAGMPPEGRGLAQLLRDPGIGGVGMRQNWDHGLWRRVLKTT